LLFCSTSHLLQLIKSHECLYLFKKEVIVFLSNLSLFTFMTVGYETSSTQSWLGSRLSVSSGGRSSHSSSCTKPFRASASVRNAINVIPTVISFLLLGALSADAARKNTTIG
jgi:hypothetical protein